MAMAGRPRRQRSDPIGMISVKRGRAEGRAFNNFPRIIAAFPDAVSDIVAETTEHLGALAAGNAPQQGSARGRAHGSWNGRPDVAVGTLSRSMKTRLYRRRGSDLVMTGRVDFKAVDPSGSKHTFAKAVEVGSVRTNRSIGKGGGHYAIAAEPFLVPSIVAERPVFVARLQGLEARLPR